MSPNSKKFLRNWTINTLAVGLACLILHKYIHYEKLIYLLAASLLLGILNSILKPILKFFLPSLVLLTLGLFMFVIKALMLYFVGVVLHPRFSVDTFWSAFVGALIISVVSLGLNFLISVGSVTAQIRKVTRPPRDQGPGGSGPVIDV